MDQDWRDMVPTTFAQSQPRKVIQQDTMTDAIKSYREIQDNQQSDSCPALETDHTPGRPRLF